MTGNDLVLDIDTESELWDTEPDAPAVIRTALDAAVAVAGLVHAPGAEVSIVLTDDDAIRQVNAQWRRKDAPTNVLSFPLAVGAQTAKAPMLGDIVFAYETIMREAKDAGRPFRDHLSHLAVHGLLHLFGYDHIEPGEADAMEKLEIAVLASLGIADPYDGTDPVHDGRRPGSGELATSADGRSGR